MAKIVYLGKVISNQNWVDEGDKNIDWEKCRRSVGSI
jgi:hypothetical protein